MRKIISKNPFTGKIKDTFEYISEKDLNIKIERAAKAYDIHRNRTIEERAKLISRLGDSIEERW
jgi:acyl-CoA reductase-like NAD-dependent aldehyde dehydrogenase